MTTTYSEPATIVAITNLLGGKEVFKDVPKTPMQAHERLEQGLPRPVVERLLNTFSAFDADAAVRRIIGVSDRTLQRHKKAETKPLNADQSARIWGLASVMHQAIEVFGSREAAQAWFLKPAMGLDRKRPVDLMSTPLGRRMVEEFLNRLKHGVYT